MARIAVVTGGSRGIGEAISLALKEAGATVVANYAGNDEKARAFTERTGIAARKWDVGDHQARGGLPPVLAALALHAAGRVREVGILHDEGAQVHLVDVGDEEPQLEVMVVRRVECDLGRGRFAAEYGMPQCAGAVR